MARQTWKSVLLASAVAIALPAYAQDAPAADDEEAGLEFDTIVVTGSSGNATVFNSSTSVSTLDLEEINDFAPRSTTEIFRNIPGIRSESSGGEGNANISVRGLPLAAGGSRFVSQQEDGIPILAFGDITFGTADIFLRADNSIADVQAIRGGSASVFAANAPGLVLNLISKTGEVEGGEIGITRGIGFDTTRVDFNYGTAIAEDLFFHVGGFYRVGEGPRDVGFNGEEGGQIKANILKRFENGFVRFDFKHLNDRTFPSFPQPFVIEGGDADPIPGFDGRDEALVSNNLLNLPRVEVGGSTSITDLTDGIRAISTAVGGEFEFDIGSGFTVNNKIRFQANDGDFIGIFPTATVEAEDFIAGLSDPIASAGTDLRLLGGINSGTIIEDPTTLNGNGLIATQLAFDVALNDLSHFVNDFKVSREVDAGGFGIFDFSLGYYKSIQQIEADYFFSFFAQEVLGDDAALIEVLDDEGNVLTPGGFFDLATGFNPFFDLEIDRDDFYGNVSWELGRLTIDGGFRYSDVSVFGSTSVGGTAFGFGGFSTVDIDVNNDGVITPGVEEGVNVVDTSNLFNIDYEVDYISYSVGANYAVTDDLAVFARFSRGGVVNADRLLLGAGDGLGTFTPDGSLTSEDTGLDIALQVEWGFKLRTPDRWLPGDLDIFATAFYSDVEISTFDITDGDPATDQVFQSFGLEFATSYNLGPFSFTGSFTLTEADLEEDFITPANVGNAPERQADFIYTLTPSYNFGGPIPGNVGLNLVGTTDSFADPGNVIEQPGFAQLNLFLNLNLTPDLLASLNVNNANNAFGITEINDTSVPENGILRGRSIPGRTISASLRYRF